VDAATLKGNLRKARKKELRTVERQSTRVATDGELK
jgi:hypothetical protein